MEGETCFILWYNEVLCLTNRCDNITVLTTLSPSPKWLWLLFHFCTFRLVESTERMVLKTSFQTLQGHSFVWVYFPFPTLSLAPNPASQISSDWQEGWSQAGLCQVPLQAQLGRPANPSLHIGRESRLLSGAVTLYTRQMAFWDSFPRGPPQFHFT